jgi:thiamine pyrophosphokinase
MTDFTVILANGEFPTHPEPLKCLNLAKRIVCCDGAIKELDAYGKTPIAVIGDLDSLPSEYLKKYADILVPISEQESNDLTKAVNWCAKNGYTNIIIIGATGKREDHTLGNISLLADYNRILNAVMITDYGKFRVIYETTTIVSNPNDKISLFSFDINQRITSHGLFYPLNNMAISSLWNATLHTATSKSFTLELTNNSPVLIYTVFS